MKKLMNNKILKAVMSVVLCVAVFFGSFVNTSVYVYATAETVLMILGAVLDVQNTVSLLSELSKECIAANAESNLAKKAECRVVWKKLYSFFESESDFRQFITDVQRFQANIMSGSTDPFADFVSVYGEDFREIFYEMIKVLEWTFPNSSDTSVNLFADVDELCEWLNSTSSNDYFYNDNGDVVMPSSDFKAAITESNTLYTPKNATGKVSYRNDTRWHDYQDSRNVSYQFLSFFENGKFLATGTDEMYSVFFYKTDTDEYYGQYQFHFYFTEAEHEYTDRDEVYYTKVLNIEYWDNVDGGSQVEKILLGSYDLEGYNYVSFCVDSYSYRLSATIYETLFKYLNFQHINTWQIGSSLFDLLCLYSSDLGTSLNYFSLYNHFSKATSVHDSTCTYNGLCDIGYYGSVAPISTKYAIDTNRIPDNYYITTNGDTVYNYTITNPETGESDSITNYVTNNYTYITAPDSGNGNSGTGGTLNGEITVGGNVNVGGEVDINVNVNVNGSEGGGSDINVDDYINTDGADVDVNDVIGKLPQLSKGFTDYLRSSLDWISDKKELYGLILLILVIGVFNMLRRR